MEKKLFFILTLFFLGVLLTPFIYGSLQTPLGHTFLGTVHFPLDYLYYLSFITQGKEHIFFAPYLFSTEPMPILFIGWTYVLLGRIGSLLHLSPVIIYQIGLLISGGLYLVSSYLLLSLLFPQQKYQRLLAWVLFMFSNTLPRIVFENGKRILAPYFSWYNYGEPFLRFESVPHHLLTFSSIFLIIVTCIVYPSTHSRKYKLLLLLVSVISGVMLGTMQPIQWLIIGGTLAIFFFLIDIRHFSHKTILQRLPLILFVGVGIPFVAYLKLVLDIEPFYSASIWEASQSARFSLLQMVQYFGSVGVLAVLGLPFFLRDKNQSRRIVISIVGVYLFLFFFPLTQRLPILTFRYWSPLMVLVFAASATEIIRVVPSFLKSVILTILFFLLVPLFFIHLGYKLHFPLQDPTYYLPTPIYDTFQNAAKKSTENDTFLIYWPYEVIFPAVAGRRELFTTKFSTLFYDRKNQDAYNFLTNQLEYPKEDFLRTFGISYIIANDTQFLSTYPFLKKIEENSFITVYKTQLDK